MREPRRRAFAFDFETAIANWRQFHSRGRSLGVEDLDELEDHLRFEIAELRQSGLSDEEVFRAAVRKVGDVAEIDEGYGPVRWEKRLGRESRGAEFRATLALLGSYVKTAWRGVVRHRGYAFLNVSGLAVALAACLVIGLFIHHSLSYDRWFENSDRIVRVEWVSSNGRIDAGLPPGLSVVLANEFPEVAAVANYDGIRDRETLLTVDGEHFNIPHSLAADSQFFEVFSFEVLRGSIADPLGQPNSIVLTESTAQLLFGDEDPVGKTIIRSAATEYTVSAVAADPPDATFLDFNFVVAYFPRAESVNWMGLSNGVFIRLSTGTLIEGFERKLNAFLRTSSPEQWDRGSRFRVEPLTRIYLHSKARNRYQSSSDVRYLYLFGGIGLLVLLLASINYMNLATARSASRAREVGVRKVVGASRSQLAKQFLGESILLAVLAFPLAALIAAFSLPAVNSITGLELNLGMANHGLVWAGAAVLLGLISVLGGSYPSLILSRFRPAVVFKGGASLGTGHSLIRRLLVGVQVVATFALVLGALLFRSQMEFVRSQRLGFDQSQVITMGRLSGWDTAKFNTFKARIESSPAVLHFATGAALGVDERHGWGTRSLAPDGPEYQIVEFQVGQDYLETVGLELLEGRSFAEIPPGGSITNLIVTESYANALKLDGTAIGYRQAGSRDTTQIVGIVDDIQNQSFLSTAPTGGGTLAILSGAADSPAETVYSFELTPFEDQRIATPLARLAPGRTSEGLGALEAAWNEVSPERPFSFQFLDDRIQAQYSSERRLANIFGVFSGLSIVIACLGLFGLAAFSAEQRTREIGIRKALGATVRGIILLLAKDYVAIVLAGIVTATPFVFILGNKWLQNFSEHIDLGPGLLLVATAAVLGFVLIAVGYQSVKAALANPTDALKHE